MRRPGKRRRLLLVSALPVLLVLVIAAKLVSVSLIADAAAGAFGRGDSAGVSSAARGLLTGNVIEPHKAVFAAGDGEVLAGNFAAAREHFQAALELNPGPDECKVRVNLVLATERLSEGAADPAQKHQLLTEALAAVEQSPAGCFTDAGNGSGYNDAGEGSRLAEAQDRLSAALAAGDGGEDAGEEPQGEEQPEQPDASRLQQLEQQARDALRERLESGARNEYLDRPDTGPGVDRPW
ncbi:hypothetical protein [Pseudarthrobacter sp. MEB009]|uniref:hypothetical protein n=1 Tax=Pseudarthrobacter sp. MEB009 TaxID=3040326 RepID=UPI002553F360|nr:hypothetical protein [Pseudarthrobacter sp. MEB009]